MIIQFIFLKNKKIPSLKEGMFCDVVVIIFL